MRSIALVVVAACSGPAASVPANTGGTIDDLCGVLDQVVAASDAHFAPLFDGTATVEAPRRSKVMPAGAREATVAPNLPVVGGWVWSVVWTSAEPDRLAKLDARVKRCPIATQLMGDGKPHPTERGAAASAIDYGIPGSPAAIELAAEGTELRITVTAP